MMLARSLAIGVEAKSCEANLQRPPKELRTPLRLMVSSASPMDCHKSMAWRHVLTVETSLVSIAMCFAAAVMAVLKLILVGCKPSNCSWHNNRLDHRHAVGHGNRAAAALEPMASFGAKWCRSFCNNHKARGHQRPEMAALSDTSLIWRFHSCRSFANKASALRQWLPWDNKRIARLAWPKWNREWPTASANASWMILSSSTSIPWLSTSANSRAKLLC